MKPPTIPQNVHEIENLLRCGFLTSGQSVKERPPFVVERPAPILMPARRGSFKAIASKTLQKRAHFRARFWARHGKSAESGPLLRNSHYSTRVCRMTTCTTAIAKPHSANSRGSLRSGKLEKHGRDRFRCDCLGRGEGGLLIIMKDQSCLRLLADSRP